MKNKPQKGFLLRRGKRKSFALVKSKHAVTARRSSEGNDSAETAKLNYKTLEMVENEESRIYSKEEIGEVLI